mgnify:CR=1 FL=1
MLKINKRKSIEIILIELEKGITYSECLDVIKRNWTLSESTFKRYWKDANVIYSERQEIIQSELTKESTEAAKERLKKAILTKDERMEIASKIAKGEGRKVPVKFNQEGKPIAFEVVYPTAGDSLRAIDFMAKVEGDYAPKKLEHDIKEPQMQKVRVIIKEFNQVKRDGE